MVVALHLNVFGFDLDIVIITINTEQDTFAATETTIFLELPTTSSSDVLYQSRESLFYNHPITNFRIQHPILAPHKSQAKCQIQPQPKQKPTKNFSTP